MENSGAANDHHNPVQKQRIDGDFNVRGEITVLESEIANAEQKSRRGEDRKYKIHTRGYEKAIKRYSRLTFYVTTLYLIATCGIFVVSRRTAESASEANRLTEESIRAVVTIGNTRFKKPIVAGQRVAVTVDIKNIGRTSAIYGAATQVFDWTEVPEGPIPVDVKNISTLIQPDAPGIEQTMYSTRPLSQNDIDRIPSVHEIPPSQKIGSIYFIAKVVYDSIGRRRETEFCSYLARVDKTSEEAALHSAAGDSNYIFITCPKWNLTNQDEIKEK